MTVADAGPRATYPLSTCDDPEAEPSAESTRGAESQGGPAGSADRVGTLLVLVLVVNEFSGLVGVLGGRVPGLSFTGLLALASAGALWRICRRGATRLELPWPLLAAMAAYVLATALSATASTLDVEISATGVLDAGKDFLFVVLLCVLGVRGADWTKVAAAIVVPMSVLGVLAGLNEFALGGHVDFLGFANLTRVAGEGTVTGRHAGPLEDANFWGRILVVGVPLALAMAVSLAGRGRRLAAAACAPLLAGVLLGIYLTSSRGAFLAAAAAVAVFGVLVQRYRRVFFGALALAPLALLLPGVGSRLGAVLGLFGSAQQSGVDSSVTERLAALQVALRMIAEHPLTGVGPGGYLSAFGDVSALTGLSLRRAVAPHNGYLGTAAEIGLLGAACWLLLIGVGLTYGVRSLAALRTRHEAEDELSPYVAATVAAIVGWCLATVFLHVTYHRVVLVLVVLAALQHPQARRLGGGRTDWAALRPTRAALVHVAVLGLAGALMGIGASGAAPDPGWVARAGGGLQPAVDNTYLIALRSRERVVPTFAVLVMTAGGPGVDAQGDPQSGRIELTATGDDPEAARAALTAAETGGQRAIAASGLARLYTLSWGEVSVSPAARPVLGPALLGGASGVLAALLSRWVGRRFRRRPQPHRPWRPRVRVAPTAPDPAVPGPAPHGRTEQP